MFPHLFLNFGLAIVITNFRKTRKQKKSDKNDLIESSLKAVNCSALAIAIVYGHVLNHPILPRVGHVPIHTDIPYTHALEMCEG